MSGLRTKSMDIFLHTSQCNYDVIVFVETWLNDDFYDEEFFDCRLYQVFRKDRDAVSTNCSRGGGVLIAVRRELPALKIDLPNADVILDQLCISITGQSTLIIMVSYIPPGSSYDVYNNHIQNVTQIADKFCLNEIAVFGDFNLGKLIWSKLPDSEKLYATNVNSEIEINLVDSFLSINLSQINCFVNSLNRILDLIFISENLKFAIKSCINPFYSADMHHAAIEIDLDFIMFPKIILSNCKYFNPENCNFELLNFSIANHNWLNQFYNSSVTNCFLDFINVVNSFTNEHIRPAKCKIHKLPWYTPGLKKLKNLRNKFYKLHKATNDEEYMRLYKQYSREFDCLNKFLYRQYLLDFQNRIKDYPKSFWQYVHNKKSSSDYPSPMCLKDKSAYETFEIVNLFATFFESTFSNDLLCDSTTNLDLVKSCIDLGFIQIEEDDVIEAIASLNSSRKLDVDGLSVFLLKKLAYSISLPLKLIFNESLRSGVFIDSWKISFVTPVFKSGRKSDIVNYRPISKLSNVSKIFEHIMFKYIFASVKPFLCPYQHAFIKGRSTTTNLLTFTNFCYDCFEKKSQVDSIYLDLSKAFDKVSHKILIAKLEKMGFHSLILKWIESYLMNRLYMVSIDGVNSKCYIAKSGVPQGSILGPLLFNLFINDISSSLSNSCCLLYADDLKLYKCVNNLLDAIQLQCDLNAIVEWCGKNCLQINIKKCFYVCFGRIRSMVLMEYYILGSLINQVTEVLDLGVLFDSKLLFNAHVDYIMPKAYAILAFIKRHSYEFHDPYVRKVLYTSLVRSKLEYAQIVWNPSSHTKTSRVECLQKKFVKFCLNSLNFTEPVPSYESRCKLIHLPLLYKRRIFQSILFVYKIIYGLIDCPYILNLISFNAPTRRLRNTEFFYVPYHRTNYAMNEPIIRTLREVNRINLIYDIDFSLNINEFKRFLELIYY